MLEGMWAVGSVFQVVLLHFLTVIRLLQEVVISKVAMKVEMKIEGLRIWMWGD